MKDLTVHLEKLRTDAEDCVLISKLATDKTKRNLFAKIAARLQSLADEVEREIQTRSAGPGAEPSR
jgi:hypothetical protein